MAQRPTVVDRSQLFLLRLMAMDDPKIRNRVREEGVERLFLNELHRSVAEYLLACEDPDGQMPEDLVSDSLTEAQQALLAGLLLEENQAELVVTGRQLQAEVRPYQILTFRLVPEKLK